MPSYTLAPITTKEFFIAFERLLWHAHHQPYQPHFAAYHPVFGPLPSDRETALLRSADRKWAAHLSDPEHSRWVHVFDEETGEVVGGCLWKFYPEQDPYAVPAGGGKAPASAAYDSSMWPEGSEGRRFVEVMLQRQYAHRKRWLRRPHAVCQQMAVHPQHRGEGIGSILMDWGMNIASRQNLELFLHSTVMARRLYERHGLRVVQKIDVDMEIPNPSDEWEKLRHELGPLRFFIMWKPVDGVYVEGQTRLPWEVEG